MNLDLAIDPGWAVGLFLAQLRAATFVLAAAPMGQAVPAPGRMAFVIGVGFAFAQPVAVPDMGALLGWGLVNAGLGAILGYLAGMLFHLFAVAGSLADLSAATSIASVIDPTRGEQGAVFSRFFQMAGLTLFHVAGGLTLLVTALGWSVRAVPLDGSLRLDPGLGTIAIELLGRLMVAGFELAVPIMAALFMIELVLGVATRFAPTANVFILGLPVKVGAAMVVSLVSIALFPQFTTGLIDTSRDTVVDLLNGVGVPVD